MTSDLEVTGSSNFKWRPRTGMKLYRRAGFPKLTLLLGNDSDWNDGNERLKELRNEDHPKKETLTYMIKKVNFDTYIIVDDSETVASNLADGMELSDDEMGEEDEAEENERFEEDEHDDSEDVDKNLPHEEPSTKACFPLINLDPTLLEKIITKLESTAYFRLQWAENTIRMLAVVKDMMTKMEQRLSTRMDTAIEEMRTEIRNEIKTRIVEKVGEQQKAETISSDVASIGGDEREDEETDIFESIYLTKVVIWCPVTVAELMIPRLLSTFSEVNLAQNEDDLSPMNYPFLEKIVQILSNQPFPNLQKFEISFIARYPYCLYGISKILTGMVKNLSIHTVWPMGSENYVIVKMPEKDIPLLDRNDVCVDGSELEEDD